MGAEEALNHPYFAPLPRKLFELPDGNTFFPLDFHIHSFIILIKFFFSFHIIYFSETSIFSVEGKKNNIVQLTNKILFHKNLFFIYLLKVFMFIQNQIDTTNEN